MRVKEDTGGWVVIGLEPGLRRLAFSGSPNGFLRASPIRRVLSSGTSTLEVSDAGQAEQELPGLGAWRRARR
jgi:hypothetical protein